MAEDKGAELFTEKARNKLRSPDDLNGYVRVVNPSGWIVLAICAINPLLHCGVGESSKHENYQPFP